MSEPSRIISIDSSGNVRSIEQAGVRDTRKRLNWLAWLLDSSIRIPGTRFSVGLDALIGIFPILGDLSGVLLSSYILTEASRMGAPKILLLRMAFNIGVEGVVGSIPFVGDVFDAAWKANQRNVRLLDAWLDQPARTVRASRLFGLSLVAMVATFLTLLGIGAFLLLHWLIGLL